MKTQKAGCILVNVDRKEIGLVYRKKQDDYSFPKGHVEPGEKLHECAVRETEEETGRKNHLVSNNPIYKQEYVTPRGEEVENYMFLAIDDGMTDEEIPEELKESLVWVKIDNVESMLSYQDLIEMWKDVKYNVLRII